MTKARHAWEHFTAPHDHPLRVAVKMPRGGLGDAGDTLDAWCRDTLPCDAWHWPIDDARHRRGMVWTVWGFRQPEPARAFAAEARRLLAAGFEIALHDARVSREPPWGAAPGSSRGVGLGERRWVVTIERALSYYRIIKPELMVWCDRLAPGEWDQSVIGFDERWRFARRDQAEAFQALLAKRWERPVSLLEEVPALDQGNMP